MGWTNGLARILPPASKVLELQSCDILPSFLRALAEDLNLALTLPTKPTLPA